MGSADRVSEGDTMCENAGQTGPNGIHMDGTGAANGGNGGNRSGKSAGPRGQGSALRLKTGASWTSDGVLESGCVWTRRLGAADCWCEGSAAAAIARTARPRTRRTDTRFEAAAPIPRSSSVRLAARESLTVSGAAPTRSESQSIPNRGVTA